tara:strand:- start:520 stop:876 length:357 start_codon:yes stop_codon:yes gene_type:complete
MAGGNYGGSSIPTTAVGGAVMNAGKNTAYSGWLCTSVVGDAAQTFLYSGQTINVGTSPVEFIMHPNLIGTVDAGLTFFCYDCSCSGIMSGSTEPSVFYSGASAPMWKPVILGGNGLNS